MRIKRSILAPLFVAVIGLSTGGWFLQRGAAPGENVYMQARLFEEVLQRVSSQFVDEKDPSQLYRMAIDGLLEELDDPHTAFLTPDDYEDLHIGTSGQYGGVGMQIDVRGDWVTVIAPLPGTPAERAGLQAGDRVIEIDGESTEGWTNDQAVAVLRGPEGEPVELKVARVGVDQPIPFTIVRAEIHVNSVQTAYMVEPEIGYLEMTVFSETSAREMKESIAKLRAQGMKRLILDLRRNPGGLLDQGVMVTEMFLDRGQAIAETRSRAAGFSQTFKARSGEEFPDLPIVVLVGPYTASASEIFAGALQDHDRALIIGQTTFGKGSVQTLYELSGGNYLKLTTGRWYTPVGRSIDRPLDLEERAEALMAGPDAIENGAQARPDEEFRTDGGRTVYGGGGIFPDVVIRPDTLGQPERDLGRALERHGSDFNDVVYTWSVRYAREHPELEPGFEVTPAIMADFYDALQGAGIAVERVIYDAASDALAKRLATEITHVKWGDLERRRRWNAEDRQVRAAIEVLQQATTPASVFAIAERLKATQVGAAMR
ncbi:MAG: S41 family peptidase [Longimicrobiales bacterium]